MLAWLEGCEMCGSSASASREVRLSSWDCLARLTVPARLPLPASLSPACLPAAHQVPVQAAGRHSRPLHLRSAGHPAMRVPHTRADQACGAGTAQAGSGGCGQAGPGLAHVTCDTAFTVLPACLPACRTALLPACNSASLNPPPACPDAAGVSRSRWQPTWRPRGCSSSSLLSDGSTACCCERYRSRWPYDCGTRICQRGELGVPAAAAMGT